MEVALAGLEKTEELAMGVWLNPSKVQRMMESTLWVLSYYVCSRTYANVYLAESMSLPPRRSFCFLAYAVSESDQACV